MGIDWEMIRVNPIHKFSINLQINKWRRRRIVNKLKRVEDNMRIRPKVVFKEI